MIKSAKYARYVLDSIFPDRNETIQAKSYLAALEGTEVKELVEEFERILGVADDIEYNTAEEFKKALAKFREAIKP